MTDEIQSHRAPLQPPGMAYNPGEYLPRKREERIALEALERGAAFPVVAEGPPGIGKSWPVERVLEHYQAEQSQTQIARINFAAFSEYGRHEIAGFVTEFVAALSPGSDALAEALDRGKRSQYTPLHDLRAYIENHVSSHIPGTLALIIENADILFNDALRDEVYPFLRSLATMPYDSALLRLRMIMTLCLPASSLSLDGISSPFNLHPSIPLRDFAPDQLALFVPKI